MKTFVAVRIVVAVVAWSALQSWTGAARAEFAGNVTVSCPAGRWVGSRVELKDAGGEAVVGENSIDLQRMLIRVGEFRSGAEVNVVYGDAFETATIQYVFWPYVVINHQPKQVVENLAVNVHDGRVLYTTYKKSLSSFSTDSFAMRCRVAKD